MPRRAVTLPEMLLMLLLLGLLAGIGVPRIAGAANRAALRSSRAELLRALDAARGAAIRLGHPVEVLGADSGLVVAEVEGPAPIWRIPSPAELGVALQGLGSPIRFGPAGIATGASNRTLRLHRGADTVAVVVSRLGRVR